jgi:hypothetical protein
MSADVGRLEDKLAELRAERDTLVATKTKEDLAALCESWLENARRRSSGTIGYVLGGHAREDLIQAVIVEHALQDQQLLPWLIGRLEQFDPAQLSAKAKAARLKKLDGAIATAEAEAREAAKLAAIAAVEREFAGEAA